MPTPRQYATNAARQAAYRARGRMIDPAGGVPTPLPVAVYRRWTVLTGQAHGILERVVGEMAAYGAERTDAWHDSERGERFSERVEVLEEVLDLLHDLTIGDHR